ncbi:hypothetical protein IFM89_029611 [Coptis chinensis]|uniref:Uncharacterized protein n=1 Tax=Coptis chinensis TaxID=261450 RepID=A0A835M4R0_9MAGN|nr:hypothetical protein IFM89_029611 [Coptis chinensis]
MAQKVVIKIISMNGAKSRTKAMKIAVCAAGVVSVELQGDQIVVTGEGIDSPELTCLLRKKFGYADLVSVAEIKKEEKIPEKKEPTSAPPFIWTPHYQYGTPPFYVSEIRENNQDPCSIM